LVAAGRDIFNLGDAVDKTTASRIASATISNTILGQADTDVEDFTGRTTTDKIGNTGLSFPSGNGANLIRRQSGPAVGVISTADPKLGPLQQNGGLTMTLALPADSPARGWGIKAGAPTTDQRGVARDPDNNGLVDIGSFEWNPNGHVFPTDEPPSTLSTTVMTTSHTPSLFGQSVTFSAIVSRPGGTPTGTVTFKDGTTVLGRATLGHGVASLTTATLTAGTHSITAVYDSDIFPDNSTANVLTQTVNAAGTKTTLASAQNPAPQSATVTFTATVTSPVSGAAAMKSRPWWKFEIPVAVNEGTVTFYIGQYAVATVAVTGGVARFARYISPPGKYPMAAVYNPGPNFTGSTSAVLTQVST
jgi:hypothetical protein